MKPAKHTPGPWSVNDMTLNYVVHSESRVQARTDGRSEVDRANARLIAAAPELLDAIEHGIAECMRAYKMTARLETQDHPHGAALNEIIMRLNEELKRVRAKATGSSEGRGE